MGLECAYAWHGVGKKGARHFRCRESYGTASGAVTGYACSLLESIIISYLTFLFYKMEAKLIDATKSVRNNTLITLEVHVV